MQAVAVLAAAAALQAGATPSVAARDGQVRVTVSGLQAAAASVHLRGGIASGGRWFGWVALRDAGGGSWWTVLRAPGYLGVYPIEVRGGGVLHATDGVVQVLPRGFGAQPGFEQPTQVAQWWTRIAPPGAVLKGITTWHEGFFTHRDPELNLLLRVRFTLLGDWPRLHLRRGPGEIFLSVARLRPDGQWRLLEAVRSP
jgi:hypothetical protein